MSRKSKYIFCTCSEENKSLEGPLILKNYTWTLTNFLGVKKSLIRGKIVLPKNDLGDGINIDNILNQLNNNADNFDFDYKPNEKDCLRISTSNTNEEIKYFKVLYENENWIKGSNPAFITISKTIAMGKIKKTTHNKVQNG